MTSSWVPWRSSESRGPIHPLEWMMPVLMTAVGLASIVLMIVSWF